MRSNLFNFLSKGFLSKLKSIFNKKKEKNEENEEFLDDNLTLEEFIEETPTIKRDEKELLGNVLELRELTASDIMIPRMEIVGIDINAIKATSDANEDIAKSNVLQIANKFVESKLSHIIVFQETLDNVIGSINIKDILSFSVNNFYGKDILNISSENISNLSYNDSKNLSEKADLKNLDHIIKPVLFVSPSIRSIDLLSKMKEEKNKMAIVVDEYGGVDGLVTFSRLIEEVIGDIHEVQLPSIKTLEQGSIIVDARTKIDDLEKVLGIKMVDEEVEVDTLGGLIVWLAGYVPERGSCIAHPFGPKFEILESDPRRVRLVAIYYLNKN